jgi:hypothetical protein
MKRFSLLFLTLVLGATFGCGGSTPTLQVQPPPGGGAMVRLPGNRGFVTVKTESPDLPRSGRPKHAPTVIVASFYQPDGTTPMSPAPTDVVFKPDESTKGTPIALSPDPKDPNRFASTAGTSFPGGLQGTIHAKIQGEDVEESFSAR